MSTTSYAFYISTTGEIHSSGICLKSDLSVQIPPDPSYEIIEFPNGFVEGFVNNQSHYLDVNDNLSMVPRPLMDLVVDGTTITGIPVDTVLTSKDPSDSLSTFVITDGEADLSGSSSGTYILIFEKFPYQYELLEVTV